MNLQFYDYFSILASKLKEFESLSLEKIHKSTTPGRRKCDLCCAVFETESLSQFCFFSPSLDYDSGLKLNKCMISIGRGMQEAVDMVAGRTARALYGRFSQGQLQIWTEHSHTDV